MTTPAKGLRRLRKNLPDSVPEQLAQWFRGEVGDTWYAILPYEIDLLGIRWRAFKAANPGARPPSSYEWLDDPRDPRHPSEERVREARKMLMRSAVR